MVALLQAWRGPRGAALWILAAALLGVLEGLRFQITHALGGVKLPLGAVLVRHVLAWLPWAFYGPFVLHLGRRWPLHAKAHVRSHLVRHLVASLALAGFQRPFVIVLAWLPFWNQEVTTARVGDWALFSAHTEPLLYWVLAGAQLALAQREQERAREMSELRLKEQLTRARLETLSARLQPHFFFNTLNSLAALAGAGRGTEARELVEELGGMMREILAEDAPALHPLEAELRLVERYLAIEQRRLEERLRVERAVDPETLDAQVPRWILQPLVENAVLHGIGQRVTPGRIVLRSQRSGPHLRIEVDDDGPVSGGSSPANGHGVGLAGVRARLAELFGDDARLELLPREGGGTVARVELPWSVEVAEWIESGEGPGAGGGQEP